MYEKCQLALPWYVHMLDALPHQLDPIMLESEMEENTTSSKV